MIAIILSWPAQMCGHHHINLRLYAHAVTGGRAGLRAHAISAEFTWLHASKRWWSDGHPQKTIKNGIEYEKQLPSFQLFDFEILMSQRCQLRVNENGHVEQNAEQYITNNNGHMKTNTKMNGSIAWLP